MRESLSVLKSPFSLSSSVIFGFWLLIPLLPRALYWLVCPGGFWAGPPLLCPLECCPWLGRKDFPLLVPPQLTLSISKQSLSVNLFFDKTEYLQLRDTLSCNCNLLSRSKSKCFKCFEKKSVMTLCALLCKIYIYICVLGVCRVLHEHIQRLSKVVTANHRALQIPEVM